MGVKLDVDFGIASGSGSASFACINFGGGIDIKLSRKFFLNAQYTYKAFDYDVIAGSFFSAGIGLKF